jgi:hypothetical protein
MHKAEIDYSPVNAMSCRVMLKPGDVLADGFLMTPTHVKLAPSPARRIVGTLSQTQTALQALGLETLAA